MEDNDGGWTVILRRKLDVSKRVNFTRSWDEYVHGFGDLNTEFWYGLRNIHCLTTREQVDLQVLLNLSSGTSHLWTYHHFVVDRPEDKYTLHVGEAEGPSGFRDTMAYHNGRPFSTYDNDNDAASGNCALHPSYGDGGGWWYGGCSNYEPTRPRPRASSGQWQFLDYTEMNIRPKRCTS